jgi:hypothetical protein
MDSGASVPTKVCAAVLLCAAVPYHFCAGTAIAGVFDGELEAGGNELEHATPPRSFIGAAPAQSRAPPRNVSL